MQSKTITSVVTYGILATAAGITFTLPENLGPQSSHAQSAGGAATLRLSGVVRDFKSGQPDFGAAPAGGVGHYAGNVLPALDSAGLPVFAGSTNGTVTDFTVTDGGVVPNVSFVPMITVIGAAISAGGAYDVPVTVRVHVGSTEVTPFGSFDQALAGNVNKAGNPRKYVYPSVCAAQTPVWIEGKSWLKTSGAVDGTHESDWSAYLSFSSAGNSSQVKVLRNGDSVPNVAGFDNQASLKSFVTDFLDAGGDNVVLNPNQAIYFFELGTTNMSSPAADMQDLVVLVTLGDSTSYVNSLDSLGKAASTPAHALGYKVTSEWKDSAGNNIPPQLFNVGATTDVAGTKGAYSNGGISSGPSFEQWFSDRMGVNLSMRHDVVLTQNAGSVWEYLNDTFYPIDMTLLGNEGAAHNYFFTYSFSATFTHHAGQHRFFEFKGADDAWMFIDGKLAMDLGGVTPGTAQYVDVDRLPALTDNQPHTIQFFYAQRNPTTSMFRLRTSLDLAQPSASFAVSGAGD